VWAVLSGPLSRNGFALIRGQRCQPSVYEGSPFAVVRAVATTTTAAAKATTATIAISFARTA
jgi:hypothetical protein